MSKPVEYASEGSPVVLIHYEDLVNGVELSRSIETAYGADGLGILVVKGIPEFVEKRKQLLPLAAKFASLPDATKLKYEHEASAYNFGWSHGKEIFNNAPDYAKGSYYANPLHDEPFAHDKDLVTRFPSFCAPNLWPKEDLPELESAFKQLGQLIVQVGCLVAKHCDQYVHKQLPSYPADRLYKIIKESRTCKARLLHYFPAPESKHDDNDSYGSWCGWHNDHGSLTGLTSAMFMNSEGQEVPNPDPNAGLYIKSRKGELVKAVIPVDCCAFQMGECEQVHSAGYLQATPHCVHAAGAPGISRETFAVFMEPEMFEPMSLPAGTTPEQAAKGSSSELLPKGIPPLASRYQQTYDFGQFTNATLAAYHPQLQLDAATH